MNRSLRRLRIYMIGTKLLPVKSLGIYRLVCSINRDLHMETAAFWKCRYHQLSSKHFNVSLAKCFLHSDSESDSENELDPVLHSELVKTPCEVFRTKLYPESNDPLIHRLYECNSIQDVFSSIDEHRCGLNSENISQAVATLWDLQKMYLRVQLMFDSQMFFGRDNQLMATYKHEICGHPTFQKILDYIEKNCEGMTPDSNACVLLYLMQIGMDVRKNPLQQKLARQLETLIENVPPGGFPISALSRFSVSVKSPELWSLLTLIKTLPHILMKMDDCTNVQEFYQLTVCLWSCRHVLSEPAFRRYAQLCQQLMESNVISVHSPTKIMIKVIAVLSHKTLLEECASALRTILLLVASRDSLAQLKYRHLVAVHNAYHKLLEPAETIANLELLCTDMVDAAASGLGPSLSEHYLCLAAAISPAWRVKLGAYIRRIQENVNQQGMDTAMFTFLSTIFHQLKETDPSVWDIFWQAMARQLEAQCSNSTAMDENNLAHICRRYVMFCSKMRGTYRHKQVEAVLTGRVMASLCTSPSMFMPNRLATAGGFLLALADPPPTWLVPRLSDCAMQFSAGDCLVISHSLNLALQIHRHQRSLSASFFQLFVRLDTALNARECDLLNTSAPPLSLHHLNLLLRAYIIRKASIHTPFFKAIIERYRNIESCELSSRNIRNSLYNMVATRCVVPELMAKMEAYLTTHSMHLQGDTFGKFMSACYKLGYTPSQDGFTVLAADMIFRDRERINSLSLLQAAVALSLFHSLPICLVQFIFTIEFLERIDAEMFTCYSKETFPERVKLCLMQLNRSICLDQPEAEVPWFHTKYCEDQAATERRKLSPFREDVLSTLLRLVGGKDFVQEDARSPYGYRIDFQICLDRHEKPMVLQRNVPHQYKRVALLLVKDDSTVGNGDVVLRRRHLEILGYHVVEVLAPVWNAMFMAEPRAKAEHLSSLIWPVGGLGNAAAMSV